MTWKPAANEDFLCDLGDLAVMALKYGGIFSVVGGLVAGVYSACSMYTADPDEIMYVVNGGKTQEIHGEGRHFAWGFLDKIYSLPTTTQKTTVVSGQTSVEHGKASDGSSNVSKSEVSCMTKGGEQVEGMFRVEYKFDKAAILQNPQLLENLRAKFDIKDSKVFTDTTRVDQVEAMLNSRGIDAACSIIKKYTGPQLLEAGTAEKINEQTQATLQSGVEADVLPINITRVSGLGVGLTREAREQLAGILNAERRGQAIEQERKNTAAALKLAQDKASIAGKAFTATVEAGVPGQYALSALCLEMVRENPNLGPPGACLGGAQAVIVQQGTSSFTPSVK